MDSNIAISSGTDVETVKHKLYDAVLRQEWEVVAEIYKEHPTIHASKITKSKDTALHVAITHGAPHHIISKMVDEIETTVTAMETLAAQNIRKDTPLHYAALRGSPAICERIIRVDKTTTSNGESSLVCKRNKHGETPLFLAALNGRKQTFLYLHSVCSSKKGQNLWKRKGGDTILHCTIQREYFDLAFLIIHLFKDQYIATSLNEEGIRPLRVLACIPSAFKSVTYLTWWNKLCYSCHTVEQLKFDTLAEGHVLDVGNSDFFKDDAPVPMGYQTRGSIRKTKEKHVWGAQIMEELVKLNYENYAYDNEEYESESSHRPRDHAKIKSQEEQNMQGKPSKGSKNSSSALLIAIKFGLMEMVTKIISEFPVAIYEKTPVTKRNVVLQAVQKRQTHVFKILMEHPLWPTLREAVDIEGNNVLHLAAKLPKHMPWEIHGSAMQMQWEAKWFEYVKENMPPYLSSQDNKQRETPEEIFAEQHKELVKESNNWLKDTTGSYSIVAALTAGVTYATSYTVPGGNNDTTGKPILESQPAFNIFAHSVLVSFCFSITSLAAFLAIYSSRMQPKDFRRSLPLKLCLGLTSFFVSIVSMLVSFCAAHSFELDHDIKHKVSPWYSLSLIPLCFYAVAQIPLYWDLLKISFTRVPQPKYMGEEVPI